MLTVLESRVGSGDAMEALELWLSALSWSAARALRCRNARLL